jgi:hypothetical protein
MHGCASKFIEQGCEGLQWIEACLVVSLLSSWQVIAYAMLDVRLSPLNSWLSQRLDYPDENKIALYSGI